MTRKQNNKRGAMKSGDLPIVLLHAFPLNHRMWDPQIEYLRNRSFRTIAPDYPGFGRSRGLRADLKIEDYADAVSEILNRNMIDKAIFVGLSMGGYVAFSLFRQRPELFAGLLLANTRAGADTPDGREKRLKTIEFLRKHGDLDPLIQFHLENFFTDRTRREKPGLVTEVIHLMRSSRVEAVISALQAMAGRRDSHDLLPQMNIPVTVVAGASDQLTTVESAEKMANLLPAGTLEIITDAAHLSNLEKPSEFNRILDKLLSGI